jgi:hypothetical protein
VSEAGKANYTAVAARIGGQNDRYEILPPRLQTAYDAGAEAVEALADAGTPGYWVTRSALTTALHALQLVKASGDPDLAAMAAETLAKVGAALADDPWGAGNVTSFEMHERYAVVRNGGQDGEVLKVIAWNSRSGEGLSYFDSLAEWEAADL